jgi:hypothetical protein
VRGDTIINTQAPPHELREAVATLTFASARVQLKELSQVFSSKLSLLLKLKLRLSLRLKLKLRLRFRFRLKLWVSLSLKILILTIS